MNGKVSIPLPPSVVPRSPMSPISPTPLITGPTPRIPFPFFKVVMPTPPYGLLYSNTLVPVGFTNPLLDGEIVIGSTTGIPIAANITAGPGIAISNGPNSITVINTYPPFTWQTIIASQTMVTNNGYIGIVPGPALSLALPVLSSVGDRIEIILDGALSYQITQAAGQQIKLGMIQTTAGVFGSLSSTGQGDSIVLICTVANLRWLAVAATGNPIIV